MDNRYRNPVRRNRNIGTAKQGRGRDNRMVVPGGWPDSRVFWENLPGAVCVECETGSHPLAVLVEPTKPGYFHACTVDDVVKLISLIPENDIRDIRTVVLRQPKKKEERLRPVWGRIAYHANFGRYSGPSIHLEAQHAEMKTIWDRSLTPHLGSELESLKKDGHRVTSDKRRYIIESPRAAIRNTQLYRTLPHETGHYLDYLNRVIAPAANTRDQDEIKRLKEIYRNSPPEEKEAFAHRYAEEFFKKMQAEGALPFPAIIDAERMKSQGLSLSWFAG